MQQPIFFENEIVQPKNLNFLNDSTAENIKDVIVAVGGGRPGKVSGLTLSGVSGNNYFVVSAGYGFTGDGERVEVYSTGLNFGITFTGTQNVYLNYTSSVWNPDPTINPLGANFVVTNVDPTDSSLVAVESYNLAEITLTSGANYIPLGTVSADTSMLYLTASSSGSQNFTIGGIIDLNTSTINGVNIASGSVDSNIFAPELHYDITLSTGTDILMSSSGNSNIGSSNNPLANVYALTGNFHQIVGFSPILIDTLKQVSGTSLEATGNNSVQIDTQNQGTRFANGITITSDSISTVGLGKNIDIATDPLQRVNINSTVNIEGGNSLFVKGDITVSGSANFGAIALSSITGNMVVAQDLSYGSTSQNFTNLVPNSDFSINSSGGTGIGVSPGAWSIVTPNSLYAYGPPSGGNTGQFLSITGTQVTAISNSMQITGNYTVEMSIRVAGPTKYPYSIYGNTVFHKVNSNPSFNSVFYVTPTSGLVFALGANSLVTSTGLIQDNQWYNVAYTWNGSQRRIYIDGSLVAGPDSLDGSVHTNNTYWNIGGINPNQALFNGLMKDIRIANVALTSFASGSAAPLSIPSNQVVGYWPLNNSLSDSSGFGNGLVYNGGSGIAFTDTRLGQVFSGTTNVYTNDIYPTGSQNCLYGTPHTSTWLLGSGVNIDITGVFMASSVNMKPNTTYNISYHAKLISGNNSLGVVDYIYGLTSSGTYVQSTVNPPVQIASSDWARVNRIVTTPESGSNFNLGISIANINTTGSVNAIFGLTGFQITEGPAIVPYASTSTAAASTTSTSSKTSIVTIPLTNYAKTYRVSDTPTTPKSVYSKTFTGGGFASISLPLNVSIGRSSGGGGSYDVGYTFLLYVDGVLVSQAYNAIPYALANTLPYGNNGAYPNEVSNYEFTGNGNLQATTYLTPGNHTVEVKLTYAGGDSGGLGQRYTYRAYGAMSPIQITLFG